ncbi:propionyl-coenzyme A carboxylase alpha polypeptide [Aquibium carbonis]|uniref:Propionyl-coenzyme A carboxylase alpha polypeptide n=1 Tax=Aquibium carbonis TaxID=2495581 RepID=A0A429Z269_9HYPH|nr:propionyl-coenzyme A carboxylase alpha polypeptide [Aquibium carbonis]
MMSLPYGAPLCLPASPPQGGRSAASASTLLLRRWRLAKTAERAISPLVGEMAGRPEGGAKKLDAAVWRSGAT